MSLSFSRRGRDHYYSGGGRRCDTYHRYDDAGADADTASLRDGFRAGRRLRPGHGPGHGHGGRCSHDGGAAKSPLFLGITVLILIAALVELAIFFLACLDLWRRRRARGARNGFPVAQQPPVACVPVACVPVQQPVCASA